MLVTVIVRSMDRPELGHALQSIARQDYPAIETIVVDATGGRHRPLPPQTWAAGHSIRVVSAGVPQKRAQAANLGLASASGECFTFLDDDDTCEPSHVSTLAAAASANPAALVAYGRGRLFNADATLDQVFGRPFNRALMHFGPLFYWQAALIRTHVRELGCRFDPAFEICEDRDFLAQIAEHGDFVFVPHAATFNYRPDLGTSGTGNVGNRDAARVARFENMLRAKWAGAGVYHNERVAVLCRQGVRAYREADYASSRRAFAAALALYPDDPNAMHGLGRVALAQGDRQCAEHLVRAALAINPTATEYHETLAAICGPPVAARRLTARPIAQTIARTSACPCGSGLRFKACCGRLDSSGPVAPAQDAATQPMLREAQRALDYGETAASFEWLQRAAAVHCDATVGLMLETVCARLTDDQRQASLWSMAARSRREANVALAMGSPRRVLIVGPVGTDNQRARQAVLLAEVLSAHAEVLFASDATIAAARSDRDTCLVFLDAEDVPEQGCESIAAERIVIRMARDDPAALVRAFARLAGAVSGAPIHFTLPHAGAATAGDGGMNGIPIEYPWVPATLLEIPPADPDGSGPLVLGRHGPGERGEDHPDDAMFYRRLAASGHRVTVPATDVLREAQARAFGSAIDSRVELVVPGPALEAIDVFLYRGDPNSRGQADARLLEAMAAARVPVVFAGVVGAQEWIDDGENGFVVSSEDEASERIAHLAANRPLLRRLGLAARNSACAIMQRQRASARAFYLTVSLNE
jgi:Glycosyl transferase family 2/SEC-C motif